jgi:D-3-phosphoglycerate dehydrogenase
VWTPAEAPEPLRAAIRSAGGELVDLADATAIVWYGLGPDPRPLGPLLHDGIRWVQVNSAGVDHWIAAGVMDEARTWTSLRGALGTPVAEHAMALILAGLRRLVEVARAREWIDAEGQLLAGKTVGIVGAGGIGRALIDRLRPFGVRILAISDPPEDVPGADRSVGPDGLDDVLAASDVVVLAMPLTRATRGIIGPSQLALIGSDGWLVNIARGPLVQTDALVDALRAGRLAGAALDVVDPEPLPADHPLWAMDNVVLTPHSANSRAMGEHALIERARANVARFGAGEPLLGLVDVAFERAQQPEVRG